MTTTSITVQEGQNKRFYDFFLKKEALINDDGSLVRTEAAYEALRNAMLSADCGFELLMIRVGKNPADRRNPHFCLHAPALRKIYLDPLQSFRSTVEEFVRCGRVRLWSFPSRPEFWLKQPLPEAVPEELTPVPYVEELDNVIDGIEIVQNEQLEATHESGTDAN